MLQHIQKLKKIIYHRSDSFFFFKYISKKVFRILQNTIFIKFKEKDPQSIN